MISVSLSTGWTFSIKSIEGGFSLMATAIQQFTRSCKGFLGNFDGSTANEFMLPDGTILSASSSMERIHWDFGTKWIINENESLFTYSLGESYSSFANPSFTPSFLYPDPSNASSEEKAICGDSLICNFDYVATGNLGFAEETAKFDREINETLRILKRRVEICPDFLKPANGNFNATSGYFPGSKISFFCFTGSSLDGKSTMTCNGRSWSTSPPRCVAESEETTAASISEILLIQSSPFFVNLGLITIVVIIVISIIIGSLYLISKNNWRESCTTTRTVKIDFRILMFC